MPKAVIVHCWEGNPNHCWYPQTRKELEAAGFEVSVPAMPDTEHPALGAWLPTLAATVGSPGEDTHLVGHSIGCATIMRYIEAFKPGERVGTVVLVAGFTHNLGYGELDSFFETPLDFKKIRSGANRFVLIHSDDDPYVPMSEGERLKKELGATLVTKHTMKHFSGPIDNEESCLSLPDVSRAILGKTS